MSLTTILIDGLKFEGPRIFGKDEIPAVPAIALICTEAGEGMKIMSIIHDGKDIAANIASNPKMGCWKSHAFHGNIDVYLNTDDMSEDKREQFRVNGIIKRKQYIFCDEPPKLEDDW